MAALAGLDAGHRAVIVLRYLYDMSPSEIAGALGLPRGRSTRVCVADWTGSPCTSREGVR